MVEAYAPEKSVSSAPVAVILGPAGAGKTTLFNSVMDRNLATGFNLFSITDKWVKHEKQVDS